MCCFLIYIHYYNYLIRFKFKLTVKIFLPFECLLFDNFIYFDLNYMTCTQEMEFLFLSSSKFCIGNANQIPQSSHFFAILIGIIV